MEKLKQKRELNESIQQKKVELEKVGDELSKERLNTEFKEQNVYGGQFGQEVEGVKLVSVPKNPAKIKELEAKQSALSEEMENFKNTLTSFGA